MKAYKLTDENNQTRDHTQWGPGISHTANGNGKGLCSDGWIHFYTNPLIAILMNPAHANFLTTRLWECETSGAELHVPLKSGCKTLKTVKEIPLPKITEAQKIAFGILSAKEIYHNEKWNSWADKWLSGEDRSNESAITARAVSATAAAAEAASATWAAWAAWAAANAAAAIWASDVNPNIDFLKLAEKALTYK